MDYQELKQLEDDLWEAADQWRANSKLTASECSMPVLGLIFLRHATTRFNALRSDPARLSHSFKWTARVQGRDTPHFLLWGRVGTLRNKRARTGRASWGVSGACGSMWKLACGGPSRT